MKYDTYSKYHPRGVALAESAFLTAWSGLGRWHEDMVLVGGLVPKYLCGDTTIERELPRPVTLDADIGIALGASIGQYGSLMDDLSAQDFELSKDEQGIPRFQKVVGDFTIYLDFLTEDVRGNTGVVVVDRIPANVMPGINRALESARLMDVQGVDLYGASQQLQIRVCEIGCFLALKLRAFGSRQQPKDAFDILYTLLHYDKGTQAAVAAFAEEVKSGNSACPDALLCLRKHFSNENAPAPMRAAYFVHGQRQDNESDDVKFKRTQIQQDMVDAGRMLLGVA